LHCQAKITLSPGGRAEVGKTHALTVNDDQPIKLRCRPVLLLRVGMLYEIVRTEDEVRPHKTLALREGDFQIYRSWS
jgi:hypothetical protein